MKEVGYVEGRHYVLEVRNAAGKPAELGAVARTLVAQNCDVILLGAGITLVAVTAATHTIPIVVAAVTSDPVRRGDAASLARPGGNVTGLSGAQMEGVSGKWLEFIREVVPSLSRVVVVMKPYESVGAGARDRGRRETSRHRIFAHTSNEFGRHRHRPRQAGSSAWRWADRVLRGASVAPPCSHCGAGGKKDLPAMYTLKAYVEAGGLMSPRLSASPSRRDCCCARMW
jgi:hypothetical protein